MRPKILIGASLLLVTPPPSNVTVATGFELDSGESAAPIVSGLGCHPFPYKVQGFGHQQGPLWRMCMWYQVKNSGILEEWVSFVTALEHCLPTNVN